MNCDFHVGQKVVCVNDELGKFNQSNDQIEYIGDLDGLTVGKIYTIREVFIERYAGHICVKVEEIFRPYDDSDHYEEPGYHHKRFRDLKEVRTEMFNKMLLDAPKQLNKLFETA